jgi:hypothetical protein
MRDALRRVQGFKGAAGELSFQEGTEARRKLRILTVKDQLIRVVP